MLNKLFDKLKTQKYKFWVNVRFLCSKIMFKKILKVNSPIKTAILSNLEKNVLL